MKTVIQRVKNAEVRAEEKTLAKIERGLLVLLGIEKDDNKKKAEKLAKKILNLRIFPSKDKNIDSSVEKIKGEILIVPQVTLCADTSKGNRPSFAKAASPDQAEQLYNYFIDYLKESSELKIASGEFGAMMEVKLTNDGPVTITIEK